MEIKERRFTLNMTENLAEEVETLSEELGISKGEALKRGFALLRRSVQASKEGYHLGISKDPQKLDKELIILY
jgi:hypothetical protein